MQSETDKDKTVEEVSGASSPEFFPFASELVAVGCHNQMFLLLEGDENK